MTRVVGAAATAGEQGALTTWVVDVIEGLGAVGVGLRILAETVFPPIPSEVVLGFAGFRRWRSTSGR